MTPHACLAAAALLLALAGCGPLAAEYSSSEAPKAIRLDNASARIDLRFARGSDRLLPPDAAGLRQLAASGRIDPSDRVTVAVGGSDNLAAARFGRIAGELAAFRIAATRTTLAAVPPDGAIINTGRFLVTLPPCPNFSKPSQMHFTNSDPSNWGCATAVNLGRMVWHPADLVEALPPQAWYSADPNVPNTAPATIATNSAALAPTATIPGYFSGTIPDAALRVGPPPGPPVTLGFGTTPAGGTAASSGYVPGMGATGQGGGTGGNTGGR